MAETDPALRAFSNALTDLIAAHRELSAGTRGAILFTALTALIRSSKGSPPTCQEMAELLAMFTEKLVRAGLVLP